MFSKIYQKIGTILERESLDSRKEILCEKMGRFLAFYRSKLYLVDYPHWWLDEGLVRPLARIQRVSNEPLKYFLIFPIRSDFSYEFFYISLYLKILLKILFRNFNYLEWIFLRFYRTQLWNGLTCCWRVLEV